MFTNGEIVDLISKKFSIQGINFEYPTIIMICFLVDRILKTNETLPTRYKKNTTFAQLSLQSATSVLTHTFLIVPCNGNIEVYIKLNKRIKREQMAG